ncbi:hypothetical protein Theba_1265 [Mesotoga prima MesG1.Ag.4.2]|uniref:Sigma E regulatory protein, MucB/RseB n=1 Tax=Mesotoga prima MesG1.Ag.4.2 TaxID=660470 RepID=I2F4V0_9BACT|nr:hypothetical protein [Mesotoga prima]AFK06953.1 hypothetical protein Theba_1265 [Mesotoga prima MesG1.Ag.4.2]
MKKLSVLVVLLLVVGLAVGKDAVEELTTLIDVLKNSSYEVDRYVQESGIVTTAKNERVIKSGPYKLVTSYSSAKGEFGWVRNSSGHFAIFRTRSIAFEPLTKIKDVEDNFIDLVNRKSYVVDLFLDLPNSRKITISSGNLSFEVTYDDSYKLLKLVKSYPFHTISASYRNYSEMSHEALSKLSNATEGMIIIRPPIYFSEAMLEKHFAWSSMDFATDGKTYLYTVLMYSIEYGRMVLYFSFNTEPDYLQKFSAQMAQANGYSYAIERLSENSAISLLGMIDTETLSSLLEDLY